MTARTLSIAAVLVEFLPNSQPLLLKRFIIRPQVRNVIWWRLRRVIKND